mmetsp:Transcript_2533/g.3355  ORF Transcript_2533/g.3355 Transcript_2533/m.3355 type:complete len:118 (+) Transcript_2533:507-860(+)
MACVGIIVFGILSFIVAVCQCYMIPRSQIQYRPLVVPTCLVLGFVTMAAFGSLCLTTGNFCGPSGQVGGFIMLVVGGLSVCIYVCCILCFFYKLRLTRPDEPLLKSEAGSNINSETA